MTPGWTDFVIIGAGWGILAMLRTFFLAASITSMKERIAKLEGGEQ